MEKYIMALDAGTTSSRCILFNKKGEMISMAQKEFTQYFRSRAGWSMTANEIWLTQLGVAAEAMASAGAGPENIAAIGITNQRETAIVWDRRTGNRCTMRLSGSAGEPRNSATQLKRQGLEEKIREKTGLTIDNTRSSA